MWLNWEVTKSLQSLDCHTSMDISHNTNNKRIAKNSAYLYVRMILSLLISLYTSRVVLELLGASDFGIYNVVGGVVTMFSFLNSSMSVASSRFVTFAIGEGNVKQIKDIFNQIRIIHYVIAILILLLIESAGLYFLYNKLVIPDDRMYAAFWVLQLSAFSCCLSIISTPYSAIIIAYEKMASFAYISIFEVTMKLLIAYLLFLSPFDRLIFYALLVVSVQGIVRLIYILYCNRSFPEIKGRFCFKRDLFNEIFKFAGWNILGNLALMTIDQGINILLNIFFGPIVNAARGIANQVNNAINGFASNIRMAINPQITKSYSKKDMDYMRHLVTLSSTYAFYLLFIFIVPIWTFSDIILRIWLVDVPEYTITFLRFTLLYTLVNSFANPIIISVHATGRIRKFQIIEGIIMLLTLPMAYLFVKNGLSPISVYYAQIIVAILSQAGRLKVVLPIINFPFSQYARHIILPTAKVSLAGCLIILLCLYFKHRFLYLSIVLSVILSIISILCLGLEQKERMQFAHYLKNKIR
ncbi:MATE family efflux transporter [Bacteroides sp.]|uniref:MATE family efflux transporter n=1 Tax=Bacteroides sp. TaxID=29523 RepID=UPI003AB4E2F2